MTAVVRMTLYLCFVGVMKPFIAPFIAHVADREGEPWVEHADETLLWPQQSKECG